MLFNHCYIDNKNIMKFFLLTQLPVNTKKSWMVSVLGKQLQKYHEETGKLAIIQMSPVTEITQISSFIYLTTMYGGTHQNFENLALFCKCGLAYILK